MGSIALKRMGRSGMIFMLAVTGGFLSGTSAGQTHHRRANHAGATAQGEVKTTADPALDSGHPAGGSMNAGGASGPAGPGGGAATAGSTVFRNVFWQPNEMVQGSVTFFTVEMARPATRVSGRFLGKELSFFHAVKTKDAAKAAGPDVWYSLAGVDLETQPGSYDVTVTATVPGRGVLHMSKKVDVAAGDFKVGTVEVPENFVNPDDAGKRQIALDNTAKARAYTHVGALPQWSGDFVKPVAAPSTPSFGMTRVYNEELTSEHRGTDFPIKEGAVVSASNAGTVVLAREMFYEGGCIIVDHGQRFFTIYMHLSKMEVAAGDKVTKGQQIGLTGATGRVTGPHLHMGVRWNGAYIDPTKLLALTLPETGAESGPAKKVPVRTVRRMRR